MMASLARNSGATDRSKVQQFIQAETASRLGSISGVRPQGEFKVGKMVPYIVFGAAYGLIGLALGALVDELLVSGSLQQAATFIAAPAALLLARRFGKLLWPGVLLTSVLIAFGSYAGTVAILHAIAVPAGGSVGFLAPARTGGWPFAISNALLMLSPLVWLYAIGRLHQSRRSGVAA
jgi:hypothetical protein